MIGQVKLIEIEILNEQMKIMQHWIDSAPFTVGTTNAVVGKSDGAGKVDGKNADNVVLNPFTAGTADVAEVIDPSCVVLDDGTCDTVGVEDNDGAFVGSDETEGAGNIDGNNVMFLSFV